MSRAMPRIERRRRSDDQRALVRQSRRSDEDLPTVHHVHLSSHVVGLRRGQIHEEWSELVG